MSSAVASRCRVCAVTIGVRARHRGTPAPGRAITVRKGKLERHRATVTAKVPLEPCETRLLQRRRRQEGVAEHALLTLIVPITVQTSIESRSIDEPIYILSMISSDTISRPDTRSTTAVASSRSPVASAALPLSLQGRVGLYPSGTWDILSKSFHQ
ncbi:uncharacterized protein LOC113228238 [Hyposmocoma kahamanoa]|uniref:uncharacterized protein LOC113228238 n=1 Tax=Hyposmocoma kahamanoa TaxID=1477025 RepID=UPI000E6D9932|nr:uncharacterized protein LOC113228238 [Hyposmocoma kahamanoa]